MLDKILVKEVLAPIFIIIGAFVLYKVIKNLLKKILRLKKNPDRRQKTILSISTNIIKYFIIIIAILMILEVYGIDTKTLVASLSVVGLVIGLALQDILKDFIGGMSIIFENQFGIGDNITINGFRGEVIGLGIKTTKVKAYTGEVKIIANRNITEVVNHSLQSSLAVIDFGVAYETDIQKLEKVLDKLCQKLNKELPNLKGEVEVLGITNLDSSSINYRMTVLTEPMQHYAVERLVKKELLRSLTENNIVIPYQQVVIHNE